MRRKIAGMVLYLAFILAMTGCGAAGRQSDNSNADSTNQTVKDNQSSDYNEGAEEENSQAGKSNGELSEGVMAPDFTAELTDGSTFSLSEQSGKVVLLNFWATWCGPCVGEMPAFEKLYTEYGDKVSILAVNCLEDKETVNQFVSDGGYTFPVAYDEAGAINMKYPSEGIPYTLIIDGEGTIQKIYVGAADAETQYQEYKSAIDTVLEQ